MKRYRCCFSWITSSGGKITRLLAICGITLSSTSPSFAYVMSDGTQKFCEIQSRVGPLVVPEIVGYANGFMAFTQMGPNGLPTITFDHGLIQPVAMQLPIAIDFLFYHECAHARFISSSIDIRSSEFIANCEGLRKMRADNKISGQQEQLIGQYHAQQNVYANLFGTGKNYWDITLNCASMPSVYSETVF